MKSIYKDKFLTVYRSPGSMEKTYVHWAGRGVITNPKFRKDSTINFKNISKYNVLSVVDRTASWGENLDSDLVVDLVQKNSGGRKISYGSSLGAYLSLIYASSIGADSTIGFSPQYSIAPNFVQDNDLNVCEPAKKYSSRFMRYLDCDCDFSGVQLLIFGSTPSETTIMNRFSQRPGRKIYQVNGGHVIMPTLGKQMGIFFKQAERGYVNTQMFRRINMKEIK